MSEKTMAESFLKTNQHHEAGNVITRSLPCLKSEQSSFKNGYIVLNNVMRLVWDKKQWIIQTLAGGRFRNRSFCTTRFGLLRALDSSGPNEITDMTVNLIKQFPENFSDWKNEPSPLRGEAHFSNLKQLL